MKGDRHVQTHFSSSTNSSGNYCGVLLYSTYGIRYMQGELRKCSTEYIDTHYDILHCLSGGEVTSFFMFHEKNDHMFRDERKCCSSGLYSRQQKFTASPLLWRDAFGTFKAHSPIHENNTRRCAANFCC